MIGNTINVILLIIVIALYLLPTLIASARDHVSRRRIGILNLLFGWTLIGWILLFLWASLGTPEEAEA